MGSVWGQNDSRHRRNWLVNGFELSAAEFAFTPIREVSQFLFCIESGFDIPSAA